VDDPSSARLAELLGRMAADWAVEVPRFLRLATIWRPLVLVGDHMDGLYRDPAAGVAVARMTMALASLPGVHVVLSVNQDLWETTFGRQLPSALEDRLSANNVTLRGLTAKDAEDLIELRLREAGVGTSEVASFLRFVDLDRLFLGRPIGSVSARELLRHASQMWRHWLLTDEPAAPQAGSTTVPPEGFLVEDVPEVAEDTTKLAAHLAADAGGRVVSLSGPPHSPAPMAQFGAPVAAEPGPVAPEGLFLEDESGIAPAATAEMASPSVDPEGRLAGAAEAPPSTFHKLRQMLAKLKETTEGAPLPEGEAPRHDAPPPAQHGTNGAGTAQPGADLHARYETIRQAIGSTPRTMNVELPVINDLVRLAGRRFPIVNYDEVELPGLLGRSLPRWNVQDAEIIFGLEEFADSRYWKTVSSYLAGRLAELSAMPGSGGPPGEGRVKLVIFKGDAEAPALATLLQDETIPAALRGILDAVHLDPRSLASLYAMHEIIREVESGTLQADTSEVPGLLANELDFFWKRVTRPKG
jgi:hypothetical protein